MYVQEVHTYARRCGRRSNQTSTLQGPGASSPPSPENLFLTYPSQAAASRTGHHEHSMDQQFAFSFAPSDQVKESYFLALPSFFPVLIYFIRSFRHDVCKVVCSQEQPRRDILRGISVTASHGTGTLVVANSTSPPSKSIHRY
ncbi:hypothetical protein CPSG_07696 [Coccidioides posadasii str. Silveira]|uniref:Uncharacterized protein n=1 Tax=Coccidioides posadasii (strain RMSCC 757 / Silveira) TaxID=443226 RepID=E9DDQ4_COCPS|nr:hypothetical protein CPSG_07696 [Coccidioides posadasii str. Silveira]